MEPVSPSSTSKGLERAIVAGADLVLDFLPILARVANVSANAGSDNALGPAVPTRDLILRDQAKSASLALAVDPS